MSNSPIILAEENSILQERLNEMRDVDRQKDRARFRENLEEIGFLMGYELSKQMSYAHAEVQTPLAKAACQKLESQPVITGILRAALPMQQGLLRAFRKADSAFVAAYRKSTGEQEFEIAAEYLAHPSLKNRTLVLADPMLATGRSLVTCYNLLAQKVAPKECYILSIFAAKAGVKHVNENLPFAKQIIGVVDEALDANSYIVPGLGDAGDLAFGEKLNK